MKANARSEGDARALAEEGRALLAKAGTDREQAAVALLALWVASKDEAEFEGHLDAALVLTEGDVDTTIDLAKSGAFHQAAAWLVG